ncbi:MAG: InlB B-repeat-containing protein [Clostridiales bacterium]|jgi:uncharacterized repeat protein (TIGR02543 family)|nr:InlB B-repeat-containing protein [Clostridiales bacterium]
MENEDLKNENPMTDGELSDGKNNAAEENTDFSAPKENGKADTVPLGKKIAEKFSYFFGRIKAVYLKNKKRAIAIIAVILIIAIAAPIFVGTILNSVEKYPLAFGVVVLDENKVINGVTGGTYGKEVAGVKEFVNGMEIRPGKQIKLTAEAARYFRFAGWYDGKEYVSTDANYETKMPYKSWTLFAVFVLIRYEFSATADKVDGETAGTLSLTVNGTLKKAGKEEISDSINEDAKIKLTANPKQGYGFEGWYNTSGTRLSADAIYDLSMPGAAYDVTAVFYKSLKGEEIVTEANQAGIERPSGSGTESDPYLIETKEQLALVAFLINKHSTGRYNESGYGTEYFKLQNNINLCDANWTPIGYNKNFEGNFDGNGFDISHFNVIGTARTADGKIYAGLFGEVKGGNIKAGSIENLAVFDIIIKITETDKDIYVGGIVGKAYALTINNVSVSDIVLTVSGKNVYAGGIVGRMEKGSNTQTKLTASGGNLDVKATEEAYVGGIAGEISEYIIKEVYSSINVKVESTATSASPFDVYAGGFAGKTAFTAAATDVSVTGNVEAKGVGNVKAGGLIGEYNIDAVYSGGGLSDKRYHFIQNVSATGSVTASKIGNAAGKAYAGGLIGYAHSLENNVATDPIREYSASGTLTASGYAVGKGKIVGGGPDWVLTKYN